MKNIINQYETDWLASRPVFYNEKTLKVSHNINDVIDFSDIKLHSEGFNNYLDFGYSVFEQTPIKNVKFMRYSSILRIFDDNSFELEYLPDPVDQWFGKITNENDVLDLLQEKISQWEKTVAAEIVLPLSGGFDSRLLASMISDKSRLRCFTYGISPNQAESHEVVHAKKIADILHLNWQQIELGDFHKYFDYWNSLFGVSPHSHGMYHIEFYTRLLNQYAGAKNFLSGIFGDVWAGNVSKQIIKTSSDIIKLGYTHGICASSKSSLLNCDNDLLENYFSINKEKLQFDFYQIITTIRLKIILISYLISVPEFFGFNVFAPYLDMEVALSMLCLPSERRKNRQWQRDYFTKNSLDVENMCLFVCNENNLDYYAAHKIKLSPLDFNYYSPYITKNYFNEINSLYSSKSYQNWIEDKIEQFINTPILHNFIALFHVKGILHRLGFKNKQEFQNIFLKKYNAYLVLKPFEYIFHGENSNYLKGGINYDK